MDQQPGHDSDVYLNREPNQTQPEPDEGNTSPLGQRDFSAGDARDARDDEDDSSFEFEDDLTPARPRAQRVIRIASRLLPLLLLTGLLVAVAEQPDLALLFHRAALDAPVPITVVCDVPWAIIRVDGRGTPTHCTQPIGGALPMARLSVSVGQHTLIATAEGFAPYPIYIVAHPGTPGLYLTQFALTPEGAAQIIAAVNDYFASAFVQDIVYPVAFWQMLGLRAPPTGPSLLVRDQFEAVALDSYEPTYSETTYQRPITPEPGLLGVAVLVIEHILIYDGCNPAPLIERKAPVLYETRASVTFSVRPGERHWTAVKPYALNPTADIYTTPDVAATPATAGNLMALVARTNLAAQLGSMSLLAGALTVTPVTSATDWAAGVVLTLLNGARQAPRIPGARPGAIWLYIGGELIALTSPARALSPNVPAAVAGVTLETIRAALAVQPIHLCGGE